MKLRGFFSNGRDARVHRGVRQPCSEGINLCCGVSTIPSRPVNPAWSASDGCGKDAEELKRGGLPFAAPMRSSG